jgi:endoglucanase
MYKIIILLSVLLLSCGKNEEEFENINEEEVENIFSLNVEAIPTVGGEIYVINTNTSDTIVDLDSIAEGTRLKLVAEASEGNKFVGWDGDINYSYTSYTFTISKNINVSAQFRLAEGTPVDVYGQLSVDGKYIVDSNGIPAQLKGMSLFWSQWGGKYWNTDVINWLAEDWEVNVVRAAMAIEANNGYVYTDYAGQIQLRDYEKQKVKQVVDAAIAKGIYVIIDWHSHDAEKYKNEAIDFFTEMATLYGGYENVIYEIYNEPDNKDHTLNITESHTTWSTIKSYATDVIAAIRTIDPDNLILVGTPKWDQEVDDVIGNKINDDNVAYVLHFYAATHKDNIRDKAKRAIDADLPLFVSEWGMSNTDGNSYIDTEETNTWMNFCDMHKLSSCNWSIHDKAEASSALLSGASTAGNWSTSDLTGSGNYMRTMLRKNQGYSNP